MTMNEQKPMVPTFLPTPSSTASSRMAEDSFLPIIAITMVSVAIVAIVAIIITMAISSWKI